MKKKKIFIYWWDDQVNFGDVLNSYLIHSLLGISPIQKYPYTNISIEFKLFIKSILNGKRYNFKRLTKILLPNQKCILFIGSVLWASNKKCIVWGTGAYDANTIIKGGSFLAVRGKETNKLLVQQGYNECPTLGDPAILLPLVYNRKVNKNEFLGIIPHWSEFDYFNTKYGKKYKVIDLRTKNIEEIIDMINECQYILSSSLHGLIVSHVYNIPALWIIHKYNNPFKIHDYFSSVEIEKYNGFTDIERICEDKARVIEFFDKNKSKSSIQSSLRQLQYDLLKQAPFELCDNINLSNLK